MDGEKQASTLQEHWAGLDGTIHTETEQGEVWLFAQESVFEAIMPEDWVEFGLDFE
jgi:hypothetical protein